MNITKTTAALAAAITALAVFFSCDGGYSGGGEEWEPANPPLEWTPAHFENHYITINRIAYGNGLFVACGNNNNPAYHSYACYSSDGITWTESVDYEPVFSTDNMYVFYGNGWFIAHPSSNSNTHWGKSQNGKDWISIGNTDSNKYFNAKGGVYAAGFWVIAGSGGRISYSADTVTWSKPLEREDTTFRNPRGGPATYINALTYGNGLFVAGGGTGHVAYAAHPGGPWKSTPKSGTVSYKDWPDGGELVETLFDSGFINAIAFAPDKKRFVAAGGLDAGSGKAAYSDDGINWKQSGDILIGKNARVRCLAYGAGVFVLTCDGNAVWSEDGITWTQIADTTFNDPNDVIQTVCYANGTWVMAGQAGKLAYSRSK